MLEVGEVLTGGYINDVIRRGDVVTKTYEHDELLGIDAMIRKRREELALHRFGESLSPQVVFSRDNQLGQEFISGSSLEDLAKQGDETVFAEAGALLSRIHTPLPRDPKYLQQAFEQRLRTHTNAALPLLVAEGIDPTCTPNWEAVAQLGTTRVHRDYWLGNIIRGKKETKVIDWEIAGIGSPYEDLAIVELWIVKEYGHKEAFYQGYGKQVDQQTVNAYLKAKCIQFLATTTLSSYASEAEGGFYHNKIALLKSL